MNGLIVKHNSILQPLTILGLEERRLFTFCLQHYDSRENADNPAVFSVPIEKIKEAYPGYKDYKPNVLFKKLKDAVNGIQSKGYQPDPNDPYVVWWFSSLDLRDGENIKFSLTLEAMPYFLNLSRDFISYHMADVKLMNKTTAWNLYEYLKERFKNGRHPEWDETVDELRERMGALNKYPRFADFDKRCLKRPREDINNQTDLHFDYDKIKRGKAVARVLFRVVKKCSNPEVIDTEDQAKTLNRELEKVGVSKVMVERITRAAVEQSRVPEILQKIPEAKRSHSKKGRGLWAPYLAGTMSNTLEIQKDLSPNAPSKKSVLAQQIDCWESMSNYGCKASGRMGKNELCKNCEHNKT